LQRSYLGRRIFAVAEANVAFDGLRSNDEDSQQANERDQAAHDFETSVDSVLQGSIFGVYL
jgi:hypothetical protein